ncbi:MAG: VWA domain-containing protein [Candidatus Eremiobacteraeota bacterium]|nr:VWA domain-containing protein [Candidatus Eremiobacteraeota bacterium]
MLGFSRPWLLILLPLLALLWWWLGSRPGGPAAQVARWRRRTSAGLRLLTLLLLGLVLAGLRYRLPSDRLTVTFLLDQSLSARRQQAFMRDYLDKALAARPARVQVAVVHFAGEAALELAATSTPYIPKSSHRLNREESNLAAALQFGLAAQPPGQGGRLVLLTDGRQTRGDVLQAAEGSALEIDCLAIPEDREPEVLVEELRCPSSVAQKTPFDLVATIASTQVSRGASLQLWRNGKPAGRFQVDLKEGRNVFLLPQEGEKPGVARYELRVSADKDGEVANNRASGLTMVEGPSRIALVHPAGSVPALATVLRQNGALVDTLSPGQLPEDVGEWLTYQGIVLDNVPSTDLSSEQLESLAALVREAGVGLLMLGGPDSFAAGGYAKTPLAEALPLDLRVRRSLFTPPTAQLHILDKSGSMSEVTKGVEHMAMAREASIAALELLSPEDQFGVIGFDDAFKWVVPLQAPQQPKALAGRIATIRAGGGTDLFPALQEGVKRLASSPLSSRHILVLSDGATAPANFDRLAQDAQKERIVISTVAVGDGADLAFLERLARNGKGRCYVADSAHALPRIFARETLLSSRSAFDEKPTRLRAASTHTVLQGVEVESAPELLGHNLSTARGIPHRVLVESAGGDPILAVGRFGLGKTAAYTGDSGRRWSTPWARLPEFSKLLLQTVRWTLPQGQQGPLEVSAGLDSLQRLQVVARISPELAPQGLVGWLLSPEGQSQPLELVQMAPDRYEVQAEFAGSGTFVLSLSTPDGSVRAVQPVALQRSRELAGGPVQEELLRQTSVRSGGRYQPAPSEVFRQPRNGPAFFRDLQAPLLQACLLLLLLEVALRRLPLPTRRSRGEAREEPEPDVLPSQLMAKVRRPSARRELKLENLPGSVKEVPAGPEPPVSGDTLENLRKIRQQTRKKREE